MNAAGQTKTPFLFGLDFELSEGFFIENPLQQSSVLFDINGVGNSSGKADEKHLLFSAFPEGYNRYAERFLHVMNGLKYGNSFLVNL
ncbi:MAG: aminodeoxychorismate synthase component I, partial [Bacteroidia bacterium]|nr:aminodeoxychorismate synthase component I [Bacteroidia bacterium]